MTIIATQLLL